MIYLCEREIGFDAAQIGFPSVAGCRAIVLVTSGGLFGYHLNGNLNEGKKIAFAGFVNGNPLGLTKRALYVASQGVGVPHYYGEIRALAATLGYGGTIHWANLGGPSAYANFVNNHNNTCIISWRTWSDPADNVAANKGGYAAANRAIANGAAPAHMYTNLNAAGLTVVYPTVMP